MNDVTIRVPRRPLLDDPENPLEDWLTGKLTVTHPDGRLRRAQTLWKYAWCLALVGYDYADIALLVRDRDHQPEYRKFCERPGKWGRGRYWIIAREVIRNHDRWAAEHPDQAVRP